jgi:hypothetical protein
MSKGEPGRNLDEDRQAQCKSQPDYDPPRQAEPRDSAWRRCQRMHGHSDKHRNVYCEVW